jgi:hypothetical protein
MTARLEIRTGVVVMVFGFSSLGDGWRDRLDSWLGELR